MIDSIVFGVVVIAITIILLAATMALIHFGCGLLALPLWMWVAYEAAKNVIS